MRPMPNCAICVYLYVHVSLVDPTNGEIKQNPSNTRIFKRVIEIGRQAVKSY